MIDLMDHVALQGETSETTTMPKGPQPAVAHVHEPPRGPGRPRRFDSAVEEQLILDAAIEVMRRNGFADATVAEILEEAEVSSRAFYRHFPSKDALLMALLRRDAERVIDRLELAADRAATATEAIYTWLDGYLDVFFEPRRAARAAVMSSEGARRAEGYEEALAGVQDRLALPLARALRQGNESGELTSPDPEFDAFMIMAVCSAATGATERSKTASGQVQARALVLRFIEPAIGLSPRR